MTKQEAGAIIFAAIKADLKTKGHSMNPKLFPNSYPVSRRCCYMIGRGEFRDRILKQLPFKVTIEYIPKF
jgi:hypothetical protein